MLYEGPSVALKCLQDFFSNPKSTVLYNWAILEKNWSEMLVEALCIIQNYQVLKNLGNIIFIASIIIIMFIIIGFKKTDLISSYMPHNSKIAVAINKSRKTLYLLAEKLEYTETQIFINSIKLDVQINISDMKSKYSEYLELHFLNWELQNVNIYEHIKRALKSMDKLELSDMLLDCFPHNSSVVS